MPPVGLAGRTRPAPARFPARLWEASTASSRRRSRVRPERLREALEQAPGLLDRRAADPELGRPGRLEVRLVDGHVGRPRGAGPGQRQARPRPQQVVGALVPRRRQRPDRLLAALGPVLAGPLLVDAGPLLVLPELGDHDRDAAVRALHEVLLAVGRERRELRPPLPAPRRLPVVVRRARRRDGRVRQQAVERPGVRGRAPASCADGLLLPFACRRLLRPARRVRRVEAVALLVVARQPHPAKSELRNAPAAAAGGAARLREAALPHVALPEHDHPRRRLPRLERAPATRGTPRPGTPWGRGCGGRPWGWPGSRGSPPAARASSAGGRPRPAPATARRAASRGRRRPARGSSGGPGRAAGPPRRRRRRPRPGPAPS